MSIQRNLLLHNSYQSAPSMPDGYVQDGCILCFDGYTAPSGGQWADLSGSGNDLTLGTGVTYDSTNHCITFSSNASQVKNTIELPDLYTFEILYKADSGQWVFRNRASDATNYCPRLYQNGTDTNMSTKIANTSSMSSGNCDAFYIVNQSVYADIYDGSSDWSYWQHSPVEYYKKSIGSCGTFSCCYSLGSKLTSENIIYYNTGRDKTVTLGTYYYPLANTPFNPLSFEGSGVKVQMMRFYNRSLSSDELQQNRQLDIQRFNMNCTESEMYW